VIGRPVPLGSIAWQLRSLFRARRQSVIVRERQGQLEIVRMPPLYTPTEPVKDGDLNAV
jgi:hypothetical protein